MLIASFKGSLVALYFMHLKYDNKLYLSIFLISLLFLAVFIVFTMFDTLNRGDIYEERGKPIQENAIIYE
jgi:cytochrome c oxidase subunit 4